METQEVKEQMGCVMKAERRHCSKAVIKHDFLIVAVCA
jgi:hypothetical protein